MNRRSHVKEILMPAHGHATAYGGGLYEKTADVDG
jgi:hypothetical protein